MKAKAQHLWQHLAGLSLSSILMLTFSGLSVMIIVIIGGLLYVKFSATSQTKEVSTTQEMLYQTKESMEDYLTRMRQISDTAYYNVIKESDFTTQAQAIQTGLNTLYEGNKDDLASIAIYNNYGSLVLAEPVAVQKEDPDVTHQGWYQAAMTQVANPHFSTPHVQNLFDPGTRRYQWVISLSRAVELNQAGQSQMGVLLVDMDYYRISHMLEQLNDQPSQKYYYLCDREGKLIYHSRQVQISKGLATENNREMAHRQEGIYTDRFAGQTRKVIVTDISYTGWKLVGVIPPATFKQDMFQTALFIALVMVLMAMVLVVINRLIASRISRPLQQLDASVRAYEAGAAPTIYVGGSAEIRHLSRSVQRSYEQIETLMAQILREQNQRRKSELAVLQSQINPHFLYNTLESITWMIEGGRDDKAVFMITQLAKLFRISLSKGRTIITVADELRHAQSYLNLQQERFPDVTVQVSVPEALRGDCIVKLVLQPILENSLNYAHRDADEGGTQITISGVQDGPDLVLTVQDNGGGMDPEQVALLLTDDPAARKHGTGVGLVNVNHRLQLYFGPEYGLQVTSELDVGTTVTLRIPAIPYSDATRQQLEQGDRLGHAAIPTPPEEGAHESQ